MGRRKSIPDLEDRCCVVLPVLHGWCSKEMERHAYRHSPKKFTQPQLATLVVLKRLFRGQVSYRQITSALAGSKKMREALGLKWTPTYSALCRADKRLWLQVPEWLRNVVDVVNSE